MKKHRLKVECFHCDHKWLYSFTKSDIKRGEKTLACPKCFCRTPFRLGQANDDFTEVCTCGAPTHGSMICDDCDKEFHEAVIVGSCEKCVGAIGGTCPFCGKNFDKALAIADEKKRKRREARQ